MLSYMYAAAKLYTSEIKISYMKVLQYKFNIPRSLNEISLFSDSAGSKTKRRNKIKYYV